MGYLTISQKRWKAYTRERAAARARASGWVQRAHLRRLAIWMLAFMTMQLLGFMVVAFVSTAQAQTIPREAARYQLTLKREAQFAWGLQAPVATFAAQVHQESRWRLDARSPVGAVGLAQFMPSTSNWIGGLYPGLNERAPTNPTWSLRALVTYDKWLADRIQADDECQDMAFALSAYNGGLGWVYKRQKLSQQPGLCLGGTCTINPGITPASQRENQHYPEAILLKYEPLYLTWGNGACQ